MRSKSFLLSLLFVVALPHASWGGSGNAPKIDVADQMSVSQELHPTGPTIKREWRKTPAEPPYQIQYEGIRSGHLLWGQARLVRNERGAWYVETSAKKRVYLLGENDQKTKRAKTFTEAGQVWKIAVSQQSLPVTQAGIATESEPALDLKLLRR